MSVTVQPLTDAERDAHRCAYCDKRLTPRSHGGNGTMFFQQPRHSGDPEIGAEAQLAALKTNRRIISIRRSWSDEVDKFHDKTGKRTVYRIDVAYYPDDDWYWGYDGLFCSSTHAQKFAHASYRGGMRMQHKKEPA